MFPILPMFFEHVHIPLVFVYIVKSSYFSRWNSKWYEKLIVSLTIFNLKEGNRQGFQKNPKSETVISIAYGTEFVSSMASIVFYLARLFVLCLYCHILLTNLRQQTFFIQVSKCYKILGLMLPDKQFFYFAFFLTLLLFIVRLVITNS